MKPDVVRLHGADIHDRCPGCGFIVERDACAMGCKLTRCKVAECRELIEVGGAHVCPPQVSNHTTQTQESA